MASIKTDILAQIELAGGRHDEVEIYGGTPGDTGLTSGPDSMSWEINGYLASVTGAGAAAILMEVLHPSVMHGVFTQSSYRTNPYERSRNTLGYVLRTTFGNTQAATGGAVRRESVRSGRGPTRQLEHGRLSCSLRGWSKMTQMIRSLGKCLLVDRNLIQ